MHVNRLNSQTSPNFKGFVLFSNLKHTAQYTVANKLNRGFYEDLKLKDCKDILLNTDCIKSVEPLAYSNTTPQGALIIAGEKINDTVVNGYIVPPSNKFMDVCNAIKDAVKDGFSKFNAND